jgi:Zn ribbon nucleic-acid-binding protein
MSKKVELDLECPQCQAAFKATLYRTIWVEFPEHMDLIEKDQINVVHCPACGFSEMPPFPFLATNVRKKIAVWYEPIPDKIIDSDIELYRQHYGEDSYLANAPRIKSWEEFKMCLTQLNGRPEAPHTLEDLYKLKRGMQSAFAKVNSSKQRSISPGFIALLRAWGLNGFWAHPSVRLVRQAAKMGWVAAGVVTTDGYRNTKLSRGWLVSVVWYRDENVELLAPAAPHRFDDFTDMERWIALTNKRNGDEISSPETRFMEEVEDFIRSMGRYYGLVLPAQTIPEFLEALTRVYKAGFQTNTPAKVIGMLTIDGANHFNQHPEYGVRFLEEVANNLYAKQQL